MRRLPLTLALLAAAGAAQAVPYAPLDVRAAGMGGTGVASAKAGSAALFNPAMLSAQREGDKFQFVLGLGGLVADEGEMFDEVDAMQDSIDVFNDLADQINVRSWSSAPSAATLAATTPVHDRVVAKPAVRRSCPPPRSTGPR